MAAITPTTQHLPAHTVQPWMFCGGMLGVLVVLLFNIIVPKISASQLTLLSFLGQVFSGIAIDLAFGQSISDKLFWGSMITTVGLFISMLLEYWTDQHNNK